MIHPTLVLGSFDQAAMNRASWRNRRSHRDVFWAGLAFSFGILNIAAETRRESSGATATETADGEDC